MSISLQRYWVFFANDVVINDIANESLDQNSTENETTCHANDVMIIKAYLIGVNGFLALNLPLLLLMIYHSARGSITDVKARSFVAPLLYLKWVWPGNCLDMLINGNFSFLRIFLVLPETALNVIGTLWIFCGYFACLNSADSFANTIVECKLCYGKKTDLLKDDRHETFVKRNVSENKHKYGNVASYCDVDRSRTLYRSFFCANMWVAQILM